MTADLPYRRGNLRDALLRRAVAVTEERGADALSLRELARDAGVSHAAPARHFADRQALLDAVAVEGFRFLAEEITQALASAPDLRGKAHRVARAYIAFAVEKGNLVGVMFRHGAERDDHTIGRSADQAFQPLLELFRRGEAEGVVAQGKAEASATLFLAALQGIAALVNCGVVSADAVPPLIDDLVSRFVGAPTAR